MPTSDLQINSKIRAVLARHWIDSEKLHFRTTAGTVRFHGVLARQGGFLGGCDVDSTLIDVLISEIRRIAGVQKVYFTGVEVEHRSRIIETTQDGDVQAYGGTHKHTPEAPKAARARASKLPEPAPVTNSDVGPTP